jgi:diguanylate cyclase (GGDEF)-like protein/PAS domain S-box-containing protein
MIHFDGTEFTTPSPAGEADDRFYREALDAAGVGSWRLDMITGQCFWDAAASRLLGLPPVPGEGEALAHIHPDDQAMVAASRERSFATGESHDLELRVVLPDGSCSWLRGIARPRCDADGERRWLYGVVLDIGSRRESERALAESQRRLATLIDNLPGIAYRYALGRPGRLEFVSDGAEAITGHPAEAWMAGALRWADLIHSDDRASLSAAIGQALADGSRFCSTYRFRHRSGDWRWLQERGQAIRSDTGEVIALEGFVGDVTEQKALETSLRAAKREAQRTSRKLADVLENTLDRVYSLDHDLRFTYANSRALEQRKGRPVIGESILDVLPGIEESEFGHCYHRVLKSGAPETIEAYFAPSDRWFEAHVTPTEGGITVFYRDISGRKKAEEALVCSNARAHSILDSVPQVVWAASAAGECDYLSPQWQAFSGRDHRGDLGQGWTATIHPDDREVAHREWMASVANGTPFEAELRLRDRTGAYRWILTRALPERDAEGKVVRWYGTCTDVHARVEAQAALEESEALVRSIVDASPDCIKLLDEEGKILFVNRLGPKTVDLDDATPLLGTYWVDLLKPEAAKLAGQALDKARGGETATFTMQHPTAKGRLKWWDIVVTPVSRGGRTRIAVIAHDITHQKKAEEEVRWAANHDPLTGLPNRLLFQERLDALAAKGDRGGHFALLLLDVDDFKRINDTLGHDAGDSLLCTFAERLGAATRSDDFVARLGGDEFAVILSGTETREEVAAAVETILAEFRRPHVFSGRVLDCNASIGASLFPEQGRSRAELLKHADIALYVAKSSWRGNLRIFDPTMRSDMQSRVSMVARARRALDEDLIRPHYQPQLDLRSGRIAGFEALLRWSDGDRGIQLPDTIAAAFEDISTAAEISDRMITKVIRDMRSWLDEGVEFGHVAINASAAEFRKSGFAEGLIERLEKAQVPADHVQLEVTETVFLGRGAECVERALKTMAAAGIRIALDDFGTGYASLSHLRHFPVDVLKIDRTFVAELGRSEDAEAIVRAVIGLGRSLDMAVVAEGVETVAQSTWLKRKGCHIGQGHLFAAALPAAEIRGVVERFNGGKRAA